jgi:hypothetical protein
VRLPQPGLPATIGIIVLFVLLQVAVGLVVAIVIVAAHGTELVPQLRRGNEDDFRQFVEQLMAAQGETLLFYVLVGNSAAFSLLGLGVLLLPGARARSWYGLQLPRPSQIALVLLSLLPLQIVISELSNWMLELLPSAWVDFPDVSLRSYSLVWVLLLISVGPGFYEEVCFRGLIGRGLVARWGFIGGIAWTALFFGAVHLHPVQGTAAALLGVAIHLAYLWTRSLWVPILIHMANNASAVVMMRYSHVVVVPGANDFVPGTGISHTPGLVLVAAGVCLVAVGGLLFACRTKWRWPDGTFWSPGYSSTECPPPEAGVSACGAPVGWAGWAIALVLWGLMLAALLVHVRWL